MIKISQVFCEHHICEGECVKCLRSELSASRQECAMLALKLQAMEVTGVREIPSAQALLNRAERAEAERDAARSVMHKIHVQARSATQGKLWKINQLALSVLEPERANTSGEKK